MREIERTLVETSVTGNEILTNFNTFIREDLGENNSENQSTEPSQISNEIQVWTQIMEQKNDDKIPVTSSSKRLGQIRVYSVEAGPPPLWDIFHPRRQNGLFGRL